MAPAGGIGVLQALVLAVADSLSDKKSAYISGLENETDCDRGT